MDPYIGVLLVEQEPETISVVSLFLSEIKECRLQVCSSGEEALLMVQEWDADLVLFAHGLMGRDSREILAALHRSYPDLYIIVSVSETERNSEETFMAAGANDCLLKDKNYVTNLVTAVKRAFIRISERDCFEAPNMPRAEQVALDENLPDIVFSLDLSGRFLYVNRALQSALGHEPKDVVGQSFLQIVAAEEDKERLKQYLTQADVENNFRGKVGLRSRSGVEMQFEINCTILEGEMIYGVARKESEVEEIETYQQPEALSTSTVDPAAEMPGEELEESIPAKLGPYKVITLLGAGAMGRVYKGLDEHLDRLVAIKVLNKYLASDNENLERFHREAKILASIMHPNIALIYYFGNLGGLPFFCMEYLPGGSVESLLSQKGVLDMETAVSFTMQVALGLNKALEKGIVHFDVKPSNMMIAENDRIKIVDFGLAHTRRELENALSSIVGSPAYLAPEQVEGGILDHRCDIYSLGVSFFEMLYGFVPITGDSVQEIFTRKVNSSFPALETLDVSVPPELYEIILRMTSRDPAKRYATYSEIVEELERFRRSRQKGIVFEMAAPAESSLRMRGQLYDRPFAEVLAEIARKNLSGKLTLSWIDLCKTIHFKDGRIIAVLSNQEGERFIDLLLSRKEFSGEKARKFRSASFDLFETYSSMIEEVTVENRAKLAADVRALASEILSGMFSWEIGEFLFEEGKFPAQMNLQIDALETVLRGVKELMNISAIKRRLLEGNCVVRLSPNFEKQLQNVNILPADRFLLYRFQNTISFKELHVLSVLSEDEFCRLVYLFFSLDVFQVSEIRREESIAHRRQEKAKAKESITVLPIDIVLEKPSPRVDLEKSSARRPAPRLQANDMGLYYYQCALKSFESKNNWAAVEYCKKALQYRSDSKIYLLMGNALATHPSFRREALEAYKKGLEASPVDSGIHRAMGDLYYLAGSYALAKSRYQEALKINPDDEYSKHQVNQIQHKKK